MARPSSSLSSCTKEDTPKRPQTRRKSHPCPETSQPEAACPACDMFLISLLRTEDCSVKEKTRQGYGLAGVAVAIECQPAHVKAAKSFGPSSRVKPPAATAPTRTSGSFGLGATSRGIQDTFRRLGFDTDVHRIAPRWAVRPVNVCPSERCCSGRYQPSSVVCCITAKTYQEHLYLA